MHIRASTRRDGDFHRTEVAPDELELRRRTLVDLPWTMLDQVHSTLAVRIDQPGGDDGTQGDIAVTALDDAVLGVWAADCVPVVLIGSRQEFAVVHAGWRGLAAGVIDAAVEAFGEPVAAAVVGPHIGSCCYEFGDHDLHAVAVGVHAPASEITGSTTSSTAALDVRAAVAAACAFRDVPLAAARSWDTCTGCTYDGYSHRVRRDRERHVVAAWRTPEVGT